MVDRKTLIPPGKHRRWQRRDVLHAGQVGTAQLPMTFLWDWLSGARPEGYLHGGKKLGPRLRSVRHPPLFMDCTWSENPRRAL